MLKSGPITNDETSNLKLVFEQFKSEENIIKQMDKEPVSVDLSLVKLKDVVCHNLKFDQPTFDKVLGIDIKDQSQTYINFDQFLSLVTDL